MNIVQHHSGSPSTSHWDQDEHFEKIQADIRAHKRAERKRKPHHKWRDLLLERGPQESMARFAGVVLHTFMGGDPENPTRCWPSQEKIAGKMGCCVRTLFTYLKVLEVAGWITREKRPKPGKREWYTIYTGVIPAAPVELEGAPDTTDDWDDEPF